MPEFFDLISFLSGLAGGIAISFVFVKINKRMTTSGNGNVVDQSKSSAGRDIIGGNKN